MEMSFLRRWRWPRKLKGEDIIQCFVNFDTQVINTKKIKTRRQITHSKTNCGKD